MSVDMNTTWSVSEEAEEPTEPAAQLPTADQKKRQHHTTMEVPTYFSSKTLSTRILGALLLIPASPLIVLLVLVMRCTSPGPGLFRQKRVGRWGQGFMMYKIRTMYEDAEKGTGPVWCKQADARVTCVGRVLRFLHLDELPQLINIARGEMDLIGPRPERPEIVEKLINDIPDYTERLAVLPGVTGLAQINLPPDETVDCVRRKLVLDLEYIETASWGLDLRILICTVLRMCGIRHGHAVGLLKLARTVPPGKKLPLQKAIAISSQPVTVGAENGQQVELLHEFLTQVESQSGNGSPSMVADFQPQTAAFMKAVDPLNDSGVSVLPRKPK